MKKYYIKHPNGTYYKYMTMIGPCFGAKTPEESDMPFKCKEDAAREMMKHSFAFTNCNIKKITTNL